MIDDGVEMLTFIFSTVKMGVEISLELVRVELFDMRVLRSAEELHRTD